MREIRIPVIDWSTIEGVAAVVPVKVDWPELQLTEAQVVANALDLADGKPPRHPDPSIFHVRIERPEGNSGQ